MLNPEERARYRSELIAYYIEKQSTQDETVKAKIRRQVINQDDKALFDNYVLIFNEA